MKTNFLLSKLLSVLLTLFGISIFVFVVLRVIPGDTITGTLGTDTGVLSPEQIDVLKKYYGIDKSLFGQYTSWMGSFLRGDLG